MTNTRASKKTGRPKRRTQARSVERKRIILDAASELLETTPVGDLSLYQVADLAGIPPSSVYHFFPKINALLSELAEEIFEDFDKTLDEPLNYAEINNWRDITIEVEKRFVDYYRRKKYARDLILGQHLISTISHADYLHDDVLGKRIFGFHERLFVLPPLPADRNIFAIALQIADKIYSISHQEHGNITDTMAEEGQRAAVAYLSCYLPEYLVKKPSALE
ncbi:TetR/AcrR family transcriptional regulator [Pseudovibrio exalbescens]|uniref:HTH tetR-type domain-containing protein n=1 Tax=Pseudovibrio exalbescens TaxID=197461 RepID=A0A1U7JK91_9HYPH|nr:TetR/AcrR family transcriptional regulator [Pseudovibrio exalbescens]OKL45125.1 hypothetical protein A3843_05065 [Pseudovibrio exalbescens]